MRKDNCTFGIVIRQDEGVIEVKNNMVPLR